MRETKRLARDLDDREELVLVLLTSTWITAPEIARVVRPLLPAKPFMIAS